MPTSWEAAWAGLEPFAVTVGLQKVCRGFVISSANTPFEGQLLRRRNFFQLQMRFLRTQIVLIYQPSLSRFQSSLKRKIQMLQNAFCKIGQAPAFLQAFLIAKIF